MVSEAQKRANKRWDERNRERKRYISYRSQAKGFIRKHSTLDDLELLEDLIADRRKELKKES